MILNVHYYDYYFDYENIKPLFYFFLMLIYKLTKLNMLKNIAMRERDEKKKYKGKKK